MLLPVFLHAPFWKMRTNYMWKSIIINELLSSFILWTHLTNCLFKTTARITVNMFLYCNDVTDWLFSTAQYTPVVALLSDLQLPTQPHKDRKKSGMQEAYFILRWQKQFFCLSCKIIHQYIYSHSYSHIYYQLTQQPIVIQEFLSPSQMHIPFNSETYLFNLT
jgi:hypothetical protein